MGQGIWAPSLFLASLRHRQGWLGKCLHWCRDWSRCGMPTCQPAAPTHCGTDLTSFGAPLMGSWVSGECFLADAHPSLPFPYYLSLLCFGIGALLRVISFYLSCRCSASAALIYSIQPCCGPQPTLCLLGERISLRF